MAANLFVLRRRYAAGLQNNRTYILNRVRLAKGGGDGRNIWRGYGGKAVSHYRPDIAHPLMLKRMIGRYYGGRAECADNAGGGFKEDLRALNSDVQVEQEEEYEGSGGNKGHVFKRRLQIEPLLKVFISGIRPRPERMVIFGSESLFI